MTGATRNLPSLGAGERMLLLAIWAVVILYYGVSPMFARLPGPGIGIMFLAGCAMALLHGIYRYGRGLVVFIALAAAISLALENCSVLTGFPFGFYHYTLNTKLMAGVVPLAVAPVYIAVGYLSWTIGNLILGRVDEKLDRASNVIALPLVSAFVMVQFDLVQDPSTSTYAGVWIWHGGGGFFGVPLKNFLGWYLTAWLFMQIFTLFLARFPAEVRKKPLTARASYWAAPVLVYLGIGITYIWQYLATSDRLLTDRAGHSWHLADLYETAVTVMLFTMLPSAVLALIRTFKDRAAE